MIRSRNVNENRETRPLTLSSAFLAFTPSLAMLRRIAQERVPPMGVVKRGLGFQRLSHRFYVLG